MMYYEPICYTVGEDEDGWLLKQVMKQKMGISKRLASRLKMTERGVTLNDERVYTTVRVRSGDQIALYMEQEQSDHIGAEELPLAILYEDETLLVVNKAPGVIVHPTHGHYTGTLANAVMHHWQKHGVQAKFRAVSRLDEDTSGVIIIAKTPYAHQHIAEQMHRLSVTKSYLALVEGELPDAAGTVDAPIDRHALQPQFRTVQDSGKHAVTHYTLQEQGLGGALVALQLETGRTHQIRVHMHHLGCPLFGDAMYGYDCEMPDDMRLPKPEGRRSDVAALVTRQALHCRLMEVVHPASGEQMSFIAPLPQDMENWRQLLMT